MCYNVERRGRRGREEKRINKGAHGKGKKKKVLSRGRKVDLKRVLTDTEGSGKVAALHCSAWVCSRMSSDERRRRGKRRRSEKEKDEGVHTE